VTDLAALIRERRIIVCCGSGGVGKTTTAAAIAVEGARQGRRTCVVTIDPARRLADALGLESLTNSPGRVDGAWPGELWALMLDTRSTFDDAVARYARDQAQAQAITDSRLYRNLCDTLSGTQEYMAVEKLYQLHQEGGFELIVVDTPPTGRAEDFLRAPRHLSRLLDNPVFRILAAPGRVYLRAVAVAPRRRSKRPGKSSGWKWSSTLWPSFGPSRAWRPGSAAGPSGCSNCWLSRRPPSCWSCPPAAMPSRRARRSRRVSASPPFLYRP
jgi:hypothetical protein